MSNKYYIVTHCGNCGSKIKSEIRDPPPIDKFESTGVKLTIPCRFCNESKTIFDNYESIDIDIPLPFFASF